MRCTCGLEMLFNSNKISTPRGVTVWKIPATLAPIRVDTNHCPSCDRTISQIYSVETGELIKEEI